MKMIQVETDGGEPLTIPSNPRDDLDKATWGLWLFMRNRGMVSSDAVEHPHPQDNTIIGYHLQDTLTGCFSQLWGHLPWVPDGKSLHSLMTKKLRDAGRIILVRSDPRNKASIWWVCESFDTPGPEHTPKQRTQTPKIPPPPVTTTPRKPAVEPEKSDVFTQIMHDVQLSNVGVPPNLPFTGKQVDMVSFDPELEAISLMLTILGRLNSEQRGRVLQYVGERLRERNPQ